MIFDGADYYDVRGDEVLTHESPEEAIADYIELWLEPTSDVEAVIRERGPITVTAHRTKEVTDYDLSIMAGDLEERLCEQWAEDYGNPEEEWDPFAPEDRVALEALLRKVLSRPGAVWACEESGKRVYEVDEVIAIMREYRKDWFEP